MISSDDPSWERYRTTVLEFENGTRIPLGEPVDPNALAGCGIKPPFAVLTSMNPRGRIVDDAENQRLLESLRERLIGTARVGVRGCDPDGSHGEDGFGVMMSPAEAEQMAREFDQSAIYWCDDDGVFWIRGALVDSDPIRLPAREV